MNRAGVPVTIETTAEKHGGNANMFIWRWGKVFAKGPETQQPSLEHTFIPVTHYVQAAYVHGSHYRLLKNKISPRLPS